MMSNFICPVCGKPVYDTYQRIVGFITPYRSYSRERKVEFKGRKWHIIADETKAVIIKED
jgi:anaerobic ribonucleoside-triphosphate reductase